MSKTYCHSLFIFRRDLRLEDNTGLIGALKASDWVIPCFIFDPRQVENNPYYSGPAAQCMVESLEDLAVQLKARGGHLSLFFGKAEDVIKETIKKLKIDAVCVNRDYTPFSRERDWAIELACKKAGVAFHALDDSLLHAPERVKKTDGNPYTLFTPFLRKSSSLRVIRPKKNAHWHYMQREVTGLVAKEVLQDILPSRVGHAAIIGGRGEGMKILKSLKKFSAYTRTRDYPAQSTTHLSAHLKFGTISVREAYYAIRTKLGPRSALLRQLYWRDFFTQIAFHFPHVFGHAFHKKYDGLRWSGTEARFQAWCEGRTGFPLVDAGMRELLQTGFMHNRARMVAASFLVKDLHTDWRRGERFFAQHLADYDPAVNNGNWQRGASTGADAQPPLRILNPWRLQKRFDPKCAYIKRWIPELKNLPAKEIHAYVTRAAPVPGYVLPIVQHEKEARAAQRMFR